MNQTFSLGKYNSRIDERIEFENLVFICDENSVKLAEKLIPKFDFDWTYHLLCYVFSVRLLKCSVIYPLFDALQKYSGNSDFIPPTLITRFPRSLPFLYGASNSLGIESGDIDDMNAHINEDGFVELRNQAPFDKNSIWYYIERDDVTNFVNIQVKYNIIIENLWISINGSFFRVISMVCYCGSLDILKYLILNHNIRINLDAIRWTINGGSENMIEFLVSKGECFNDMLGYAAQYHQNSVFHWLYENSTDQFYSIPYCAPFFNTEILFFFINENILKQDNSIIDDLQVCLSVVQQNNDELLSEVLHSVINQISNQ